MKIPNVKTNKQTKKFKRLLQSYVPLIVSRNGRKNIYRHYRQPSGDFCQNRHFRQIASLQEATFGIESKSPEAGDFSPFSPLHAFLDISGDKRDKYKKIRRYVSIYFTINKFCSVQIQGKYWSELIHRFSES